MAASQTFIAGEGDPILVQTTGGTGATGAFGAIFFFLLNDANLSVSFSGGGTLDVVLAHDLELAVDYAGEGIFNATLTAVTLPTPRITQMYVEVLRSNRGVPTSPNKKKRVIIASGVADAV